MAGLVNPDPDFWYGRRVLVTGHSGFKGSWLGLWLARLGAVPLGLSLPTQDEAEGERLGFLGSIMPGVACDIRDGQAVQAALKQFAPEIVLHLAAQPLVRRSYRDPHLTFETNVMGTLNLLEAVRLQPSVRSMVIATTDKCYENREWPWAYRENDPLGGHDPYSASKACTEILAASWRNSFAASLDRPIAIATVRAGNVIGGGDWAQDRLVPDAVRAFAAGQPLALRNPQATRPWQHVLDALCGYLLLAERLHTGDGRLADAWNFGPDSGAERPVAAVLETLARLWGDGASWTSDGAFGPHEANRLALDSGKARQHLGWRPRLDFEAALTLTACWYQRHRLGTPAADLIAADIESYESGAFRS
ncbi:MULTISPECIES: CDP-glucose 4,6-dehydratase [Bosea]|uniref:CDP-glucose 4,6-dehydratase n=1 Tax=Bosea TaxID=85413 RepID=UPI0021502845|nr:MULTISPECIES: CDP-glucose 4,6-dehydratase [Bosea]MCR4522533.1 CDP-glucose 4,6-dehydratase [Bosea sp. 47.2.35]MDR6827039.1 CDP-glucose 4,6-dehydratase [Bosea robiniae]MDR6893749.1 CDP-glucose 4,6-dehydratase [Bosea sp. BE109]MDR7136551.1 CDP-glucose 4,6-dehydratase [Bosea sp. BE168]MDR7173250.1 CDP-glucose 4,6-dehydratase [Bosea sp. BE271]